MTNEEREEALAIMNVIIHMIEKQYDNDRVEKAVDTAIAALKAEPCEDAVSREFMYKLGAKCIAVRNKNDELVAIAPIESLPPVTLKLTECEDVISRETALDAVKNNYRMAAIDGIEKLPSVTPKPLTGHWIDDCPMMTDEGLVRVIRCSHCNEQRKDYYGVSKNYCPKCGAKMEGE